MEIIVLYFIVTGIMYASFSYDTEDDVSMNFLLIVHGLIWGWLLTPIIIGRLIRQIYNTEE